MSAKVLPQRHCFDERYAQKKGHLHQFIQVSSSKLISAYFDNLNNEFVGLTDYTLSEELNWNSAYKTLEQLLPQAEFQQAKKVSLCIADSLYTLVPLALFDEKELETYLNFNHSVDEKEALQFSYSIVESLSTVIVYAIPRTIHYLLKAKLPLFNSFHLGFPLLESTLLQSKAENNLFLHIQNRRFEIIYAPLHKLHYFNSFQYKNAEDLIYFLLYAMEQLNLDQEVINLIVLGEIEKESQVYELLYRYIKNVNLAKRTENIRFSKVLSEIPSQYYYSIFNQHLCE